MPVSLLDLPPGDPFAAILRNPLVVSPDTPVLETITQMSHVTARGVSPPSTTHHLRPNCAVVMDQQQVMGIFTEQDVVYLTAQQQPLKGVTIGEVMTQPVITLTEAAFTDLSVAAQQLQQHQIRHLPVVDGQGALVGVVTYESLHQTATQQRLRWQQTARQQAAVQLQASEQRYASLVATAPVGIFHADAEGHCIYVNDCWSQITGVSLDAALGEGWQQGLHPEDRDRIVLAWNQATANQHPLQFESRFQHGNGTVRWVKGQSAVERDAQGQILGYVGTITDITEHKETEAALAASEAHQRALFSALPDLILRVSQTGIYLEFVTNPDFPVVGNLGDLVGTHVAESLPPPIASQRLAVIERALQTRSIQIYEQDLSTLNNTQIEEVRVVPCGADEVLLLVRDISDRKRLEAERQQAQAALRLSEQTNRTIVEAMPDLLIRMDRAGYYHQMAGGSSVQVKYPATSPASEPDLYRVLPAALAEQRLAFAHQALETGQLQVYEQPFEVDGDQRWEEVRIAPLTDQEVLIIIRDVTERTRLEAERKRTLAILEASEQRFRQLFEATPQISVQGYDRDRQLIYWNPASEQLYGYSSTEALGQKLEDLIIPPEMRAWVVTAVEDWVAGGAAVPASELTLMDKQGNPVEVFSSHVMLNNLAGEPEMYCVDINLSPLKQAQTQLRQLNQTLEAQVIERTAALEEREARYRALVNVIPDLLIRIDTDGTYLDVITGDGVELFNPDQIDLGVSIYDVTPFAHAQERMDYVHRALQTREVQSYDYDLIINGQKISETARIVAINDTEALIIVQDISERARLEAAVAERATALRASEAQLQAMIEAIPDLLLRVAPDGTCLSSMYPSDDAQEFLPVQRHLSEVLPPELLQQQLNAVERAAATGALQVYEHRFQKGDCMVYEEVRVSAISADEVLLMVRDITQRKQIEKALHESQRFLQTVLDTVPLPVFWKDRNSVFLGGTQKLLDAVGLQSEADLIGKTDFDLVATQASAIAYRTDDQQVMESGIARLGIEETLTGPDGQQNWLETHKAPLRNWAGEVIGVVGIFQDITQRKQAEIALQTKTEELDRFFALALDMLCIVDDEGRFIHLNHQWEQTLGHPPD
ncbi:MAG: PAS domain S-box protein [Leptolyngbya sp. SIOISBB]|nr:PAS domain S-box protein [Leptolyngbya sp. SIOISBB]